MEKKSSAVDAARYFLFETCSRRPMAYARNEPENKNTKGRNG
jgi:hypothetical protein